MNDEYDVQRPYLSSFVIFRKDTKVAFILRENTTWMNGHYTLPSGKVEHGENFTDCAIREADEETAVKLSREDIMACHVQHRKNDDSVWVDVYFEVVNYRADPVNNEPHMHSELKWFDIGNLPDNLVPGMREAFMCISRNIFYSEY